MALEMTQELFGMLAKSGITEFGDTRWVMANPRYDAEGKQCQIGFTRTDDGVQISTTFRGMNFMSVISAAKSFAERKPAGRTAKADG